MQYIEVILIVIVSSYSVTHVRSYNTYTALDEIIFTNVDQVPETVHSEYFFGKCASKFKTLVVHDHMTYKDIKGKLIVRRWIRVDRLPTCAYVRANSTYSSIVRYHAYKFAMCFGKIGYVVTGLKYLFYFYEWYIPVEMMPGIQWDLYFYIS